MPIKREVVVPSWVSMLLSDKFHTRFVITAGVGAGKSSGAALCLLINALQNPKEKEWWIVAPTHSRIDDSILPIVIWAFEMLGFVEGRDYRVYHSKPKYILFFRAEQHFRFVSGDRPETIVSATIGGYWISEPGIMKRQVYEEIEKRIRSKRVSRTLGIIEGTPEGDNWYRDDFDIIKTDPRRKLRRFILETYDNAHNLDEDYISRLFKVFEGQPAKIESYIYGRFASFNTGDVFAEFIESRNVIPQQQADPTKPISLCFDFNATPLTWSAWQIQPYRIGHQTKLREICIAESSLSMSNLKDSALEIGLAFPPETFRNTRFEIWGDRTGHAKSHKAHGTDYTNLQKYLTEFYPNIEIKARREVTPIRASVDVVNRLFMYELALICENCKNVRRSLSATKWAQGKSDIEKTAGETHTHHGDGIRYRLYPLYKDVDINNLVKERIVGFN
jgi:hypothetical protein